MKVSTLNWNAHLHVSTSNISLPDKYSKWDKGKEKLYILRFRKCFPLLSILLFLDKMEASDWSVMTSDWPMTIKSSHASQSRADRRSQGEAQTSRREKNIGGLFTF